MALTDSNMLPLGTIAPDFNLEDVTTGERIHLHKDSSSEATVIIFMCNHCPYVVHLIRSISNFIKKYQKKGIQFIGINSNDVIKYPDDSPSKMIEFAQLYDLSMPYCFDETQEVARLYNAACTPDIYVFDKNLKLVYRGRYDDSRPGNSKPLTGKDLAQALDSILNHEPVSELQYPSAGCNIKWK